MRVQGSRSFPPGRCTSRTAMGDICRVPLNSELVTGVKARTGRARSDCKGSGLGVLRHFPDYGPSETDPILVFWAMSPITDRACYEEIEFGFREVCHLHLTKALREHKARMVTNGYMPLKKHDEKQLADIQKSRLHRWLGDLGFQRTPVAE